MNRKTREERLKEAQRIVARYVPKDRDLVAELIAERRAEAAAGTSESTGARANIGSVDDATTQAAAPAQPIKSTGGDI
jgi:ethanolamine utilization microcompartment shell protein EutS